MKEELRMQKRRVKPPRARYMRGSSQVQAMCLGGDWEVQARYMRGICVVYAWYMRGTCVVQAGVKLGQLEEINRISRVSEVPRRVGDGFVQQRRGWIPSFLTFSPLRCCEDWGHP